MNILSGQESAIYELIRKGFQPSEIAKRAEYHKASSLYTIIQRLTTLGFLDKQRLGVRSNYYLPLIEEYDIIDNKSMRLLLRKNDVDEVVKPATIMDGEPYEHLKATKAQRIKIYDLCMKGKKTSVIAKEVNLPRYVVNREILSMGINRD